MQYEVILPADKKACRFVTKAAAVCGSYAVLLAYAEWSFDGERCRLDKLQFIFHSLCRFEQRFHIFIIIIKPVFMGSVILYRLYFSDKIIRYVVKIVN